MSDRKLEILPIPRSMSVQESGEYVLRYNDKITIVEDEFDAQISDYIYQYAVLLRECVSEQFGLRLRICRVQDVKAAERGIILHYIHESCRRLPNESHSVDGVESAAVDGTEGSADDGMESAAVDGTESSAVDGTESAAVDLKGSCTCMVNTVYVQDEDVESYKIVVAEEGMIISAAGRRGVLYGVQTLRQILSQTGCVLPYLSIDDAPDMPNRGFMRDTTRGRVEKLESYKKLADTASYYKLNQLQLYIEHTYLFKGYSEVCRDDTPLTAEDIIELDNYCDRLGIELIPALASFGHLDKLLTTQSYAKLCELEDSENEMFSFYNRMAHHTLNPVDPDSIELVVRNIAEFIPLFRSKHFNITADETFDLGKGRSNRTTAAESISGDENGAAEKSRVHELYISFVRKICDYLISRNRIPMMWGDILLEKPEMIARLPREVICLTWAYSEQVTDASVKRMKEAGAVQYVCPGVHSWRHLMNKLSFAYENISRMCSYGREYGAIGVLNTDWGDYGHASDPDFSIPGLIYCAAFSWNGNSIEKTRMDEMISVVEYGDKSGQLVKHISELAECEDLSWAGAMCYLEAIDAGKTDKELQETLDIYSNGDTEAKNEALSASVRELYADLINVTEAKHNTIRKYLIHAEGQRLLNNLAAALRRYIHSAHNFDFKNSKNPVIKPWKLAEELELWFMEYKESWRTSSRESEMYHMQDFIFRYCDMLRRVK